MGHALYSSHTCAIPMRQRGPAERKKTTSVQPQHTRGLPQKPCSLRGKKVRRARGKGLVPSSKHPISATRDA